MKYYNVKSEITDLL